MQASASLPELIILQIIKFGISKYLYLCVEAGFSQIQSHIHTKIQCMHRHRGTIKQPNSMWCEQNTLPDEDVTFLERMRCANKLNSSLADGSPPISCTGIK